MMKSSGLEGRLIHLGISKYRGVSCGVRGLDTCYIFHHFSQGEQRFLTFPVCFPAHQALSEKEIFFYFRVNPRLAPASSD